MINLDGDGNIGGCQRQIPPDTSFGNIFTDKDPYNSLEMRKCEKLMYKNLTRTKNAVFALEIGARKQRCLLDRPTEKRQKEYYYSIKSSY